MAARRSQRRFRLQDAGFKGRGRQDGVEEGRWAAVRDRIYEGRGA
jgi:hypothetical protein